MTVKITKPQINVREELNDLKKPTGIAGEAMLRAETPQEQQALIGVGRRNLIFNGGFDVWQRGTSFTGAGYTSDRWVISTAESATPITKTASRDKRNTLKVTFGSVISCNLDQRIEAFGNVGYNQPVTLSFWVRGSKATTGDFCRIRNHTTATTLETLYYDITTSWTKVTKTFSANSTWAKDDVARLYLFSAASSSWASSDYVEFSDAQLETGKVATPFEHRSYGEELALCQRYYFKSTGAIAMAGQSYAASPSVDGLRVPFNFPVTMRATPTTAVSGGSDGGSSATLQIIYNSPDHAVLNLKSTNAYTSVWWQGGSITADAEL